MQSQLHWGTTSHWSEWPLLTSQQIKGLYLIDLKLSAYKSNISKCNINYPKLCKESHGLGLIFNELKQV